MILDKDTATTTRSQNSQRKAALGDMGRMDSEAMREKLENANGSFAGIVKAVIDEASKNKALMVINHKAHKYFRLIKDKYYQHEEDLKKEDRTHFEVYEDMLLHLFGELEPFQRKEILEREYHPNSAH